jgi:phosphatidylserine/phosphatidylglycerophosphate/cardiolipin synthase-like enzyme
MADILTSLLSDEQRAGLNRFITVVLSLIVLVAAACFLFTGVDLLGLFGGSDLPPGGAGDWYQIYFTEPAAADVLAGSVAEQLIDRIEGADETIHIAAFEFDLVPVAEALVDAHRRGVAVRWVTDDEYGLEDDEGAFATLEAAGIPVRDDGRDALMHNKFWVFDREVVWTGSTNITYNGVFRNNNNTIVISSTRLATIYEREFDEMWASAFGPDSPSTVGDQQIMIQDTPVTAYFAPEDDVIDRLVPLIEDAETSVRFMAFSFTHDDLGAAMLGAADRGVDVRGIFETRGSETEYSELTSLYCAGLPVRQDGNPSAFHHKVIVIDGEIVVTGSFNFSNNADRSNDENVIVIANRDVADHYLQEFDRRWAEAVEPMADDIDCNE